MNHDIIAFRTSMTYILPRFNKTFLRFIVFFTFVYSAQILTGCNRNVERIPGYVYLRLSSDITTLDPAMIVDVSGGSVAAKIFNGLVRFGKNAEILPDIAHGFSISQDGRHYTFRLREDVRFHNGRTLTAEDIRYSFQRVLDKKMRSSRTWLFDRISGAKDFMEDSTSSVSGIKIIDDHTLEIELSEPFGPFLSLLAMPPAYIVPREEIEKSGADFSSSPVGTGPFRLSSWRRGQELILSANNDYFEEKARIKGIVYRIIPEELTTIAEFESGNLDMISMPISEYRRYKSSPKWSKLITSSPGLNTYYLGFNCQKPPFSDKRIRQALNYAVDRKRMLKTIMEGRGALADGPIPDFLLSDNTGGYEYSPDTAKKLLKEAGYENGFSFKIYQSADQETADIMEVTQQYLKQAGIHAEIVQLEWSAFKEAINNGEADTFWLSWKADYPDPENFLFPVFHSSNWGSAGNRARFRNPEIDGMIVRSQTEPDIEKRNELYKIIQRQVIEEAPWLFFWHKNEYLIHQKWITGADIFPIYNSDKGLGVKSDQNM